jgi:hypothetical protein
MTDKVIYTSPRISIETLHEGWLDYVNSGDYTPAQEEALVNRLCSEQEVEFDKLLPDGCFWQSEASAIIGPVGTSIDDVTVTNALAESSDRVSMRIEDIEKDVLASL